MAGHLSFLLCVQKWNIVLQGKVGLAWLHLPDTQITVIQNIYHFQLLFLPEHSSVHRKWRDKLDKSSGPHWPWIGSEMKQAYSNYMSKESVLI